MNRSAAEVLVPHVDVAPARRPPETTEVHTRILRCMLATDDSQTYWRNVDISVPVTDRARLAFEQRWFGTKSEARVRTIMTDMVERFDAFPESLSLFQRLPRIPGTLRTHICHIHTQLVDPVYRAFTGGLLAGRRDEGRTTIDRAAVSRWVESSHPGRWSGSTCAKFASNLLATALDAGLVKGRRDPRALSQPAPSSTVVGYALYLLRSVDFDGTLTENPYLRSLGLATASLGRITPAIPGVRVAQLGDVAEITYEEPSLTAWALRYLAESV